MNGISKSLYNLNILNSSSIYYINDYSFLKSITITFNFKRYGFNWPRYFIPFFYVFFSIFGKNPRILNSSKGVALWRIRKGDPVSFSVVIKNKRDIFFFIERFICFALFKSNFINKKEFSIKKVNSSFTFFIRSFLLFPELDEEFQKISFCLLSNSELFPFVINFSFKCENPSFIFNFFRFFKFF